MLNIPYISTLAPNDLPAAERLLAAVDGHAIGCNCWADQFPYTPQATFQIAHNGNALFIRFAVREKHILARVTHDQGDIWTDSCVELFLALDDSGYYNFEFSCIGKLLLGFRKTRPDGIFPDATVLQSVKRYASLGTQNFDERTGDYSWMLTVAIPATALFKHNVTDFAGLQATANLYKCGSNLSERHYLTWQPVEAPKPDFHTPRCFGKIKFQ